MTYTYICDACGNYWERDVPCAERDNQICRGRHARLCGGPARRIHNFKSITIGIPAGFKTMFSDAHGIPGSPQREQFEKDVRSGEIQYAGRGSRWI